MITGQPYLDVLDWDDRDVATAWDIIDDRLDAAKDARRRR